MVNKNSRRRGDDLLESLYTATIKLTATVKLTNLTFQQIAEEANTSRTVLYRRWATAFDLLQDIYAHKAKKLFEGDFFNQMKDSGSLRGDFLQILSIYQKVYSEIGVEILNNYFYLRMQDKDNSKKPAIHAAAIEKYVSSIEKILKQARVRGEKVSKVSRITLMLPFDLIRAENLIRPGNINKKRLIIMVEEVLLPVFST